MGKIPILVKQEIARRKAIEQIAPFRERLEKIQPNVLVFELADFFPALESVLTDHLMGRRQPCNARNRKLVQRLVVTVTEALPRAVHECEGIRQEQEQSAQSPIQQLFINDWLLRADVTICEAVLRPLHRRTEDRPAHLAGSLPATTAKLDWRMVPSGVDQDRRSCSRHVVPLSCL